jgi:phosphate/sulfate permease
MQTSQNILNVMMVLMVGALIAYAGTTILNVPSTTERTIWFCCAVIGLIWAARIFNLF